jgi:uncharacterized protein YbjT (DUF2867 family)
MRFLTTTIIDPVISASSLLRSFVSTKKLKMKITVTGSLGRISKHLTIELLQKGHTVTVISSNPEKQKAIEELGATAAIGSLQDVDFLTSTFTGADAVYCMVPPANYMDHQLDLAAYCSNIANNYAEAIRQSGVKRVVQLSSIGAHLTKDSGIIIFHRNVEIILDGLPDVAITFMRPTAFHYNLFAFIPVIKNTGSMSANYGADDKVVWVAPADIATAIADEIVTPLTGRKIRYVSSDEITCHEVARILGTAIGKPGLTWNVITNEQMQSRLEGIGMNPQIAAGLVEMQASIHSGKFFDDYYLNRPEPGKTKMTDFAKEFAVAFSQR